MRGPAVFSIRRRVLFSHLAVSCYDVLVGGKFLEPHGAARMKLVCADPDLCAHTELVPVGETRGSVDVDRCRIHVVSE